MNKLIAVISGLIFIVLVTLIGLPSLNIFKKTNLDVTNKSTLPIQSNLPVQVSTGASKIYQIKGSSDKLTSKEKMSIAKWNKQVSDYVGKFGNYVYLNGQTEEKEVALTFDDGPDGKITPQILDILKAYNVKANFFCIGQNVRAFPDIVKKAFDGGNLILNHSWDHPNFYNKDSKFIGNEIEQTNKVIHQIIGRTPALVRPPYGIVTDTVLNVAKSENLKLIIWSTDTFDWSQKDASHIAQNVLDNVRPGEIILMHSNGDKAATAKALPLILEGLRNQGYKLVTLDLLLNTNAYTS